MKRAKRTSPPFNTLKVAKELEKSDFSAKQSHGVVNAIEDAQENLVTADELKSSEQRSKAYTNKRGGEISTELKAYVKDCFSRALKAFAYICTGLLGVATLLYYAYDILFG